MTSRPAAADKSTVSAFEEADSAPLELVALKSTLGVASSSVIVSVPVASEILALLALESVRVTVSLASSRLSARTATLKVTVVSPALIVNVPLVAV